MKTQAITIKTSILLLLISLTVLFCLSSVSAADNDTIFVATNGSDANDGFSWNTAKLSIKNAIGTVNTNGTIHIADGTYTGPDNRGIIIDKNMTIVGQSQTGTIIDCLGSGRAFTVSNSINAITKDLTIINGYTGDSLGGAISNNGNLTVINCTFFNNTDNWWGGAIYSNYGSTLNVTGSIFINNTGPWGGAIRINDGTLTVTDSTFTGNSANDNGGAINCDSSTATISGCTFTANHANRGGALVNWASTSTVHFSRFIGNTASQGNDIYCDGGSVNAENNWWGSNSDPSGNVYGNVDVTPWLTSDPGPHLMFVNNLTGDDANDGSDPYHPKKTIGNAVANVAIGGIIYIADGIYTGPDNRGITINKNMTIIGQSQTGTIIDAEKQGQFFIINSGISVTLQNLTLQNGTTTGYGGAIYNGGTLNVIGSTFTGNTANLSGGAIENYGTLTVSGSTFTGNNAGYYGGAIFNMVATSTIRFSRIVENTASSGNAIFCYSGSVNAENNWWGSNLDPKSITNLITGLVTSVNTTTWVIMSINATPNNINNTQTSTITADLNHINGGGDLVGGHIPDGLPVTFSLTNGHFGTLTAPLTVNTIGGIASIVFTASKVGVQEVNATLDDQNVTTSVTINPAAYVEITNEFRNLPWGNVITTAYYNDKVYAIVHVRNYGPDSTSLSVLDSFTGFNWTGTYYVLSYLIPNIQGNWIVNDTTNVFNGTHWNIPVLGSGLGGMDKWLALELVINQTGIISNRAETVAQSAYPYNGYDSYTAYLTANSTPTSLTVDNARGNNGKTVTLNSTLKDYLNNPLVGKTVEFWIDNVKIGENTTDASGVAIFNYIITQTPGNHTLMAIFNGETIYQVCNITGQLYVPKADLYIKITSNKTNPKVGENFTLTYKLGNYGPDPAENVTITIPLPEGFQIGEIHGDGNWTYNAATNTITWTLENVPVGDPYLYVSGLLNHAGTFVFSSSITSDTYTINTEGTPITINAANEVKAASNTVGMQETGVPVTGLVLAVLALFGGLAISKRK